MDELEVFKLRLGKRIAKTRKEQGITQAELGALLNKDFQSISRIENGKINISAYTLNKIAKALKVSANDLLDFSRLE